MEQHFEFLAAIDTQALKDHRVGGNLIMNSVCWKKKSFGMVLRAGLRFHPHELGFCFQKENMRRNVNVIHLNNRIMVMLLLQRMRIMVEMEMKMLPSMMKCTRR